MADNKVKFLRGTSDEYAAAEKDNDTIYFTTDDGKLYIGDKEVSGDGSLTIDDTLSDTSTNPVQNKVIKQAIDNKADKSLYGDTTINVGRRASSIVGEKSTAEGYSTGASGEASHAEGYNTEANGRYSHAEGESTTAGGDYSHAEGSYTTASGRYSHAEGYYTTASGDYSHAEGENTTASGDYSHAEGENTTASGDYSHAGGYHTEALKEAEFAHGKYNQSNADTIYSIGDGTADDARHNAFEITTDGGKLHDKDIATTDLIPTSLPANGGNADYASDANYAAHAGNAKTVNGRHAYRIPTLDANNNLYDENAENTNDAYLKWDGTRFKLKTFGGNLTAVDYATGALNATNAGNADTVDGVHAWNMHTLAAGGGSHGSGNHLMYCKHNVLGNGKFYIGVTDGYERAVAVNFAENADTVDDIHIHCVNDGVSGTSWFAVFATTNDIRAVDPARAYVGSSGGVTCSLIGTVSGCQYSTILAWANAQTTSTFASIVAATGFPSDAPYQQEALLQVQVDYYHQRKIVTWTRYLGGSNPQIRQRAIFGEAWNDNDWRVVCG